VDCTYIFTVQNKHVLRQLARGYIQAARETQSDDLGCLLEPVHLKQE